MTEQEQIKDMAQIICGRSKGDICLLDKTSCDNTCSWTMDAKALYDAGYRKASDGAVILTPEERDEEVKELARLNSVETELQELTIKYYNETKDLRREVVELKAENERLKEVIADQNELCWNCKKSVKEFAERLKKRTILYSGINVKYEAITADIIDELLKEYED